MSSKKLTVRVKLWLIRRWLLIPFGVVIILSIATPVVIHAKDVASRHQPAIIAPVTQADTTSQPPLSNPMATNSPSTASNTAPNQPTAKTSGTAPSNGLTDANIKAAYCSDNNGRATQAQAEISYLYQQGLNNVSGSVQSYNLNPVPANEGVINQAIQNANANVANYYQEEVTALNGGTAVTDGCVHVTLIPAKLLPPFAPPDSWIP